MDPVLTALLGLLEKGSPFALAAVFAILYWRADQERKSTQATILAITERAINGLNNSANAMEDIRSFLGLNRQDNRRGEK